MTICEKFAKSRNLKFSTNICPKKCKTKCIVFSKKPAERKNIVPIILNNTPLNWVSSLKHLGSILQEDNSMSSDCDKKRGIYIGKIHSLFQEFHFVSPHVVMKLFEIYTHSFYGSNLWNLFGKECDKIYKAYNVTVRNTFQIPRETHRYLIETVTESLHPQVFLSSRFVKFHRSLLDSNKSSMRTAAKLFYSDQRTVYGRNLCEISRL